MTLDPAFLPSQALPSVVTPMGTIYMPIEGLIDVAAERARISGALEKARGELQRVKGKLANQGFVAKAPPAVLEQQQARRVELTETLAKLGHLIEMLG